MINKLKELRQGGEEEGFTLIELMIVVVIIGILAAIAIPIFLNQQKGAIAAGVKSDVKNTVTNVATALVKAPTSTDVSLIPGFAVVQGDNTTIKVVGVTAANIPDADTTKGKWNGYAVVGSNSGLTGTYTFVSTTGKYTGTGDIA